MKIMILGATGRTGRALTQQALEAGNSVVAYVRHPDTLSEQSGMEIREGQLTDVGIMSAALKGCDALVLTLGSTMSERDANLMEMAVPNAITAAKAAGVSRIIVLSALGVGDTYENTRYPYRWGAHSFLKGNFSDHEAGESKLSESGLNWTTVHPGPLFNGKATENPIVVYASSGFKMPGSPHTNRGDVAALILKILNDSKTYGAKILITSVQAKSKKQNQ